ncbi:MAG: MarR family transcriptional regulator [Chryseobacterium sp.]|nr:MarR family transcriptional regulator [Chryseobacterium sp.]
MENLKALKLDNQICFPLYVISKEIIGLYRPLLEALDITYSQYLVLMVLWEKDGLTVKQIGEKLFLDSGTLTPLLKRLETKNYILRQRKKEDERIVEVFLTKTGEDLKIKACEVPFKMKEKLNLTDEDLEELKTTVSKLLIKISK